MKNINENDKIYNNNNNNNNKNDNNNDIQLFVQSRLHPFLISNRVPNIIFHGNYDSPKTEVVNSFLMMIYEHECISKMVMTVDCAIEKGDDFIREEIKFFAKTQTSSNTFKTVLLTNADFLTLDSQAALRRCIELFCQNTRFFLVMEKKDKLMAPMLSRFCEIYIPSTIITLSFLSSSSSSSSLSSLSDLLDQFFVKDESSNLPFFQSLLFLAESLYREAYSMQDMMLLFESSSSISSSSSSSSSYYLPIEKVVKLSELQSEVRNEEALLFYSLLAIYEYKNEFKS